MKKYLVFLFDLPAYTKTISPWKNSRECLFSKLKKCFREKTRSLQII